MGGSKRKLDFQAWSGLVFVLPTPVLAGSKYQGRAILERRSFPPFSPSVVVSCPHPILPFEYLLPTLLYPTCCTNSISCMRAGEIVMWAQSFPA